MATLVNVLAATEIRPVRSEPARWRAIIAIVFAEFGRALAAEQYYEELRRCGDTALARKNLTSADVPRQVFEKIYR